MYISEGISVQTPTIPSENTVDTGGTYTPLLQMVYSRHIHGIIPHLKHNASHITPSPV